MGRRSFIDFIVKNRYVILFVTIVLVMLFTGIIKMLLEILLTALLIVFAIYLGKRIQEDSDYLKRTIQKDKTKIEYIIKDDENKEKE